jgi:hypothetical protein
MFKKLLIVCVLFVQSCSVYMAVDGQETPNIQGFNNGMSKFQVESVLGGPISYKKIDNGAIAVYQFTKNNEPSAGRAAIWLTLDIFFAALPEFILTPYEKNRPIIKRVKVQYDENDMVTKLEI